MESTPWQPLARERSTAGAGGATETLAWALQRTSFCPARCPCARPRPALSSRSRHAHLHGSSAQGSSAAVSPAQGVRIVSVACGAEHSVGLSEQGALYAWGWGAYGNLGGGERADYWTPARVRAPLRPAPPLHLAPRQPCT